MKPLPESAKQKIREHYSKLRLARFTIGKIVIGTRLKSWLLKEGLVIEECSCCHNTEWLGKPLMLEVDHINGDRTDNRIENLRLLCPNCHSQTDTYRSKNGKTKKSWGHPK